MKDCKHEWMVRKDGSEFFDCLLCQAVAQLTVIWEHDADCDIFDDLLPGRPCNCPNGKNGSKP